MQRFLTFDVGTTAMKCILFDENLRELFSLRREYDIVSTEKTAELSPEVYFDTFLECIKEMGEGGFSPKEVTTLTFTTQGETFIPVDRDGEPLTPAIVWLDTRAEDEAKLLREALGDEKIYRTTGLCPIDAALPAAKVLWLSKNRKDVFSKIYKILLLEDFLIYKLTGKFVSEKSLQSSTGWYDINRETLFLEMAELCKIREDMLPEILPCASVVGKPHARFGFGEDTVVTTGAMDQISSAVGVGNIREGIFSETTGTALVVGITAENPVYDIENPVTVYKHFDGKFIYMPYYPTAGMSLKWFRDTITPYAAAEGEKTGLSAYGYIDALAEKSPAGSGGVLMLPNLSRGGGFLGVTLSTSVSDMARSVLEAVAFTLRRIIEGVEKRGIAVDKIYSLGGGSRSLLWGRIKSDVLKKTIVPVDFSETTARGAAILGASAVGYFESVFEAVERLEISGEAISPKSESFKIYDEIYEKYKKYTEE